VRFTFLVYLSDEEMAWLGDLLKGRLNPPVWNIPRQVLGILEKTLEGK
jgi:hypothetical protein